MDIFQLNLIDVDRVWHKNFPKGFKYLKHKLVGKMTLAKGLKGAKDGTNPTTI